MLSESALRKKLKDLGIPNWGAKALLVRRHQEWLNLYNSNCDASDSVRRTKRELLRELDEWERTQGGNANTRESNIMKKDWDGHGHATTHKSQFDDLIANARKRAKAVPKSEESKQEEEPKEPTQQPYSGTTDAQFAREPVGQASVDPAQPYEGNEEALASIRAKVEEANHTDSAPLSLSVDTLKTTGIEETGDEPTGIHFTSPSRKIPMFSMPEEPVVDVDHSTTVQ